MVALTTWRIVIEAAADETRDAARLTVLLDVSEDTASVVATSADGENPPSVDVEMLGRAFGLAPRQDAQPARRRVRNVRGGCSAPSREVT